MELARPTFVDYIYDFNLAAGLLQKGYDDYLESSFQVEEALEGLHPEYIIASMHPAVIANFEADPTKPRDVARLLVATSIVRDDKPSDVERLDKACDAVVFAIGSMAKLRLSPDQINRAMRAVTDANLQKLTMPKDAQGKLMKNPDFVGPEKKLQRILDEREPEKC